jgi:hypothetical protein
MAMADLWDASLEVSSAREVAEALALHMLQPGTGEQARNELPQDARAALDALLQAKGKMPTAAFERRFGAVRPMGPGKLERERPWLSPANAAEILWYRGFIFRAFDRAISNPSEMAFVPSDLAERLEMGRLEIKRLEIAPQSQSPISNLQSPISNPQSPIPNPQSPLLDDITTLLGYIQNHTVKVRANGEWTNEARASLIPMLRDGNGVEDNRASGRFALLLFLIGQLGWIRTQEGRVRLNSQPVTNWLQSDEDAQRRVLFEAWLNSTEWNDLAHVDGLSLEMTHAWANDPLRERRAIVEAWSEIGDWRLEITDDANPQSLISNLKTRTPDFARLDGRYDTWHVRDVATGEFLNGFENWDRVEGRLIRYIVLGPLCWLEGRQGGGGAEETALTPSPFHPFTLSADGTILISAASRFQRFQLARVADWSSTGEDAFTYRLTPRSMARAQEQGILPPRVIEFLEQNSGKPLPPSVLKAINRWAERGSEARVERVCLIKTKDGPTMELLLANPAIRRVMLERLASNCIAVRERDAKTIAAEIVQNGLLVD